MGMEKSGPTDIPNQVGLVSWAQDAHTAEQAGTLGSDQGTSRIIFSFSIGMFL